MIFKIVDCIILLLFFLFFVVVILVYVENCIKFYGNLCLEGLKLFIIEFLELLVNYFKNEPLCNTFTKEFIDKMKKFFFVYALIVISIVATLLELSDAYDENVGNNEKKIQNIKRGCKLFCGSEISEFHNENRSNSA